MSDPSGLAGLRPTVRPFDLTRPQRVHIIGIGGAGMRAIARVLLSMGHTVSGSDRAESVHVDALLDLGAVVHVGHDARNLPPVDVVTRSTAVPDDNPEVVAALAADVPVLARAEILTAISNAQPSLLVAGTHGKTTTSSMLAVILDVAGRAPSFIIGADVDHFGTGARHVAGSDMVIEADESDGTFLALHGDHAIVTSLDPDHLEYYGSRERLDEAFVDFVRNIGGSTVVCRDDADTGPLLELGNVITYGVHADADLRISMPVVGRFDTTCTAWFRGQELGSLTVGLPGHHNALNAAGAAALALDLGVSFESVQQGLAAFTGVARRFERRGSAAGVTFVDDYAHLPAEVEAAIGTATAGTWGRVIATYQPHRFSRTQALGHTFAESFRGVDHLVLTGIYPSGEAPRDGVTGRIVFDAVKQACPELSITYAETLDDVVRELTSVLQVDDLCLTLGAGDLTTVPDRVRAAMHTAWATDLAASIPSSQVLVGESLGDRTTYRVGGDAQTLVEVATTDDLIRLVAATNAIDTPILVVGRGSNMLVADDGFEGVAIVLVGDFERTSVEGSTVTAGAAVPLPALARQTAAAGLAGFEWAVGVPGTIGGAIAMNAGGHGSDMAASVVSVSVLDVTTGTITSRSLDDLAFGYRHSSITADDVVVDATLELAPGDPADGSALISEIVRWRREHQPGGQNAGSVFTNPVDDSAGRLIDAAGGKGRRVGSAEISTKHANFIQADQNGSADDVVALMREVADLVESTFGIRLVPETRLVGFAPFPTSARPSFSPSSPVSQAPSSGTIAPPGDS